MILLRHLNWNPWIFDTGQVSGAPGAQPGLTAEMFGLIVRATRRRLRHGVVRRHALTPRHPRDGSARVADAAHQCFLLRVRERAEVGHPTSRIGDDLPWLAVDV